MLATLADGEIRITRRRRRRRRPLDGGHHARPRRDRRPTAETATAGRRLPGRSRPGVDGLREPAATLDCGNSGTSLRLFAGHARRAAVDGGPGRRRFVARPSGRSYHRTAARDGRGAPCPRPDDSLPPVTVVGRTPLRAIDWPTPGAERAGEVGDPAGGASGRRRDDGPRGGRDARPHRADAAGAGRARSSRSRRRDGGAVASRSREAWRCRRSTSGSRAIVSAAAFWLVAGAIHPDAELGSRASASTRRAGRVIDLLRRWARTSRRRPTSASGARRHGPRRAARPTSSSRSSALRGDRHRRRPTSARGDRRDPDPVPGRDARAAGTNGDPRRGRAPPQGIGPARGHRGRALGPRRDDRDRRRRHRHRRRRRRSVAPSSTASTTIAWP